jgi:hypothetical protein
MLERCRGMTEPRKVEVAYSKGRWLAEVAPDYDEPIDCAGLQQLIDAVQQDWPAQSLLFVVGRSTIEGCIEAEAQFLEASEESGALFVSSDVD